MSLLQGLVVWSLLCFCWVDIDARTTGNTDLNFEILSSSTSDSLHHALQEKKYPETILLLENWFSAYDKLTESYQQHYRDWIVNGYYILGGVFAIRNDTGDALWNLEKAVDMGFKNYSQLLHDSHFAHLQADPDYGALLQRVRLRGDYLTILQNAAGYNLAETIELPEFTYEHQSNEHLVYLRKKYHLDSIAGSGTEISRMIALMKWVHRQAKHDSNCGNPPEMNALAFLELCSKEHRKLECRGFATILNDCYLALGFKSRILYCYPKDSTDYENHVVTVVFSDSLKKWIWLDPANQTYVMNPDGELQSAEEIRRKLIAGDKLLINNDANLNGMDRKAEDYLYTYMVKNLYWFESPLHSEFDYETIKEGKNIDYVRLLPFDDQRHQDILYPFGKSIVTLNPIYFWQKPG